MWLLPVMEMSNRPITINVGGELFTTSIETLKRCDNFFSGFADDMCIPPLDASGKFSIFVDRDPTHFRYILNYMRGSFALPSDVNTLEELWVEASFYSMEGMCAAIAKLLRQHILVGDRVFYVSEETHIMLCSKIGISAPPPSDCLRLACDPSVFQYILNYIRGSDILPDRACVLKQLRFEAERHQLKELVKRVSWWLDKSGGSESSMALVERVVERITH